MKPCGIVHMYSKECGCWKEEKEDCMLLLLLLLQLLLLLNLLLLYFRVCLFEISA